MRTLYWMSIGLLLLMLGGVVVMLTLPEQETLLDKGRRLSEEWPRPTQAGYTNLHTRGHISFSRVGETDIDRVGFLILIHENPEFWLIMVDQHEYLVNARGGMLHLESCDHRDHE